MIRARTWPPGIRGPAALAVTVWLLVGFWPAATLADLDDELASAEKQVRLLEDKGNLTRHEYLQFEDKGLSLERFESRLNDGQSLMLLKDYVRAALVFYDLVENEKYRDNPSYADAMFNLAEALFFNKNYIDARSYFQKVMDHPRGRPYRKLVLSRLMQIALNTQKFDAVDENYKALLRESGGMTPEANYLWGKTLVLRGRLDEAAQSFGSLLAGQGYYFQAQYFMGVVQIRQGKLEVALGTFTALSRLQAKTDVEKSIVELAHLARGRLLHDLGREAEALDAFQSIEHTSKHFDDALFEICWTYIQRAEKAESPEERSRWLLEGERTLEILEVSSPDSTLVPKANLLKGSILERMGKFEDAAASFMKIGKTYAGVKQQLDEMIARHDDPVKYFNEVAGKNLESFDLSAYLPPVAVKWMSSQEEMSGALGVMRDIEVGKRFVTEARALLGKLDALLKNEQDRVNLFPALAEGSKRCLEIENARVIVERTLAAIEERIVLEHVSAQERSALEAARKQREQLESALEGLPTTKKEFESRETRVRDRISVLEQDIYQSGIGLKGMKAQLTAMEEWIKSHEQQLAGREEDVREFREELRRGWATANQLQTELDDLANVLATEKARVGLDNQVMSTEEDVRKRYTEALNKERELAEQIHSRLGPEGTVQVNRIGELRLRTDKLGREVKEIKAELAKRVNQEAEKLRGQAAQEERNLQLFETGLNTLEQESSNLAGEVAYKALEDVRQKFYKLVLDADVGVLDVAWGRMQETGRKITDLTKKKNAESRQLKKEYKSVLEEVQ